MPFEAGNNHYCGLCLKQTYAFDLARAAVYYQDPIAPLISAFKFNGSLAGLSTLAQFANDSPGINDLSRPDIIIPVPLHTKRLRERKFNQASLIARTCFPDQKNRIALNLLNRVKATPPQTGLSGKERRKNLSGAFSLNNQEQVKNTNILLIDDVFTTGQTVHECAKVLRKFGAKRIEVFTLARAL